MKKTAIFVALALLSCSQKKEVTTAPQSTSSQSESKPSVPSLESGSKANPINFALDSLLAFDSEAELKDLFGENVERSKGYYPEGMGEYPNTLLFPHTKNEVEFVWRDDSINFSGLAYISVKGEKSEWKTKEGITLGTPLKQLEQLNQKSFSFYGFGWDYAGMTDWEDGHLVERKIFVSLDYPGESVPPEFEGLLGDHKLRSDSELAQRANPVVREITMRR